MNIDYQTTLEQFTMEIGNELGDLENMNPLTIIPKLQSITNSGMEPYIVETIRTCIQHYQKDRTLIKYAYLIDKLLKLPLWNQIIQNVIVEFFCDIFIFLLLQKCFHELDELKILRKFWLKTIHPRHLQAMRDIILAETGVDIDQYFKPDFIATLRNHYEKKLKLTPEEMNFHLPKTFKTSNQIYETRFLKSEPQPSALENANYFITPQMNIPNISNIHPPMYNGNAINPNPYSLPIRRSVSPEPIMETKNLPYHLQFPPYETNNFYQSQIPIADPFRTNVINSLIEQNTAERISPPIDPRRISEKRIHLEQKVTIPQEPIQMLFYEEKPEVSSDFKRERFFSEETRTSNNSELMNNPAVLQNQIQKYEQQIIENEPRPQKRIHYDDIYEFLQKEPSKTEAKQEKSKYIKILETLRNDMVYRCKECGKGQKSSVEYEKHMTEHFEEKLEKREKKKQNFILMNVDEWTKKGSSTSLEEFNEFYISISNLTSSQENLTIEPLEFNCKLCNELFDVKLIEDQWVLGNATFCFIDGLKLPMHKTCQEALEDSSNSSEF